MSEPRRWTVYYGPCPHDVWETQVVGPEVAVDETVEVMPVREHEAEVAALRADVEHYRTCGGWGSVR